MITTAQTETPASAPGIGTGILETVFNLKRPSDTDLLLLRSGEKLTGAIVNPSFQFRTAYADLELPAGLLAGIDFEGALTCQEVIVTANGNRLSGFLQPPTLVIRLENGSQVETRREKVSKAIFRIQRDYPPVDPRSRLIRLRNGDVLSGSLITALEFVDANHARAPFQFSDIETVTLAPGEIPRVTARLRNGESWQGRLGSDDIDLQLDLGPRVQIYHGRIDVIDGRAESLADLRSGKDAFHRVPDIAIDRPGKIRDGVESVLTKSTERANSHKADSLGAGSPSRSSHNQAKDRDGLVWIPPGTFMLGSPPEEADRGLDEGPQVKATIDHGFWMGQCEVTQAQFRAVIGINPSHFTGDTNRPVEKVSWQDALEYCARLTAAEHAAGKLPEGHAYRLPTEAEWEYACRAGTTTRFSYGDDIGYSQLGSHAWFTGNSGSTTNPVGTRRPNPWGLYDMHGNVWEWCLDHWAGGSATEGPDEGRNEQGSLRTARGGSWLYDGRFCRSANRDDYFKSSRCSDLGFRVVLAPLRP
ncbi:MAG: formylglycine-generating enzyme family protein, partial [Verrucomicrobia bacterium]|nr:formylglycine-generating enzyme family protein [Verrucomicrobiota bacterium]